MNTKVIINYMKNNYNKLYETQLPPQNKFYLLINYISCKEDDSKRTLPVWNILNCNAIVYYHNLYLMADLLL